MKRLNPATNQPYRCGDVHPDTGMIFRAYNKGRVKLDGTFVELWLSPDSFHTIKNKMKLRARQRREKESFKRVRTSEQIVQSLE